ncbi:unnamed protein product [Musa acuminata var. zebrina]
MSTKNVERKYKYLPHHLLHRHGSAGIFFFFFCFFVDSSIAVYEHICCAVFDMASSVQVSKQSIALHEFCCRPSRAPALYGVAFRRATSPVGVQKVAARRAVVAECRPSLGRMWREIQGSDNWDGLVEPLNPLLRDEIVRYGEFVVACYKAFDLDPRSKRYLNCKYGKKSLLPEVGMGSTGYEITKYIYATPDISFPTQNGSTCRSRWIGYTAVSSDDEVRRLGRRDILVALRGTVTHAEWIANFMSALTPARLDPNDPRPGVKVESGFLSLYTSYDSSSRFSSGSCREQMLAEVSRIINTYKDDYLSITLAGHSMGSSLAVLFGYDLAELGLNQATPIAVYSFGGPRVGNLGFEERCEELGVKVLRVVNVNDPITKMPGVLLNERMRAVAEKYELPCYAHVGVEVALDFFKMNNPVHVHDMEAYLGALKCPKEATNQGNSGTNLMSKARRFWRGQNFDAWQWQEAATHLGNLVKSLRAGGQIEPRVHRR